MSHIFMKRSLLVASYILLVIAAPAPREPPLPQLSRIDHGVDRLRIGTIHDSGSPVLGRNSPTTSFDHAYGSQPSSGALYTLTKRGGINDPHRDWQPAEVPVHHQRASAPDDYQFGRTKNGADIMEAIGLPKITPYLDLLPKNWDTGKWDRLTLEHISTGISLRSETIIRSIRDDKNEIDRAIYFLKYRGGAFQPGGLIKALKPPVVPRLPDPDGGPYEEALIKMIRGSDTLLRDTVSARNTSLRKLSQLPGSKRIPNTDIQNRYVTAWMINNIQLNVPGTKHVISKSPMYSFATTDEGEDVMEGVGKPCEMKNIDSSPSFTTFNTDTITNIATDLFKEDEHGKSKVWTIIRRVMDDRHLICQAARYIENGEPPVGSEIIEEAPILPKLVRGPESSQEYRVHLIGAIQRCHEKLRDAVNRRNASLRDLFKLDIAPNRIRDSNPTNDYVTYWKKMHQRIPTVPVDKPHHGSSGADDVHLSTNKRPLDAEDTSHRSSKRRTYTNPSREPAQYTPHVNPTTQPASAQMLHGIEAPLYPSHNVFPNPWSPNHPSTSNNVPGHLTFGLQNVHGVANMADLYDLNLSVHPTHSQPPPHSTTHN